MLVLTGSRSHPDATKDWDMGQAAATLQQVGQGPALLLCRTGEDEQDASPLTRIHPDSLTGWGAEVRGGCTGTLGQVPHRRQPCGTAI